MAEQASRVMSENGLDESSPDEDDELVQEIDILSSAIDENIEQ
jgi:hypothetical protein